MPFHDALPFDTLHKAKIETDLDASRPGTPEGIGDVYWAPDANGGDGALYLTNVLGDTWVEFTAGSLGAINISDLADVNVTSAQDNQILIYDSGSGEWQNEALNIADISDVDLSGLSDGDALIYDNVSGNWVVATNVATLGQLTDVTLTLPQKGNLLAHDGTDWGNKLSGSNDQALVYDDTQAYGMKWGQHLPADLILTSGGEVLVDASGNVMTAPF